MLARGKEALEEAFREGYTIGAFSAYNLEGAQAICRAAESERMPVVLQAGSSAFEYAGRGPLASLAVAVAESSAARVGVHLDHSRELEEIGECLEHGYTSVMIDGSELPFEENVALTREAVKLAHAAGAWVEGELGALSGDEDRSGQGRADEMTDPQAARRFVEETGVDALAVAIGNVHGFAPYEVRLDLDRLAEIRELVPVPLVLHGASGLPKDQIEGAIELGVAKINVNAELRRAFLGGIKEALDALPPDDDSVSSLLAPATERMGSAAREKIRLFARARADGWFARSSVRSASRGVNP